jgi:hypothetical protein
MKKFLAIIGAIFSGAISLAIFVPHAAEAGIQFN